MPASKFVKPNIDCKTSYLEALEEYHAEGRYQGFDRLAIESDFEKFVEDINSGQRHLHNPYAEWAEPVPETIFWITKGQNYIGTLTIRHRLNWHLEKWGGHVSFIVRPSMRGKGFGKKILHRGKPYMAHLGIERALLTVSPDNAPAIKIIEFCGGVFEDETPKTEQFPIRKRYKLDCV